MAKHAQAQAGARPDPCEGCRCDIPKGWTLIRKVAGLRNCWCWAKNRSGKKRRAFLCERKKGSVTTGKACTGRCCRRRMIRMVKGAPRFGRLEMMRQEGKKCVCHYVSDPEPGTNQLFERWTTPPLDKKTERSLRKSGAQLVCGQGPSGDRQDTEGARPTAVPDRGGTCPRCACPRRVNNARLVGSARLTGRCICRYRSRDGRRFSIDGRCAPAVGINATCLFDDSVQSPNVPEQLGGLVAPVTGIGPRSSTATGMKPVGTTSQCSKKFGELHGVILERSRLQRTGVVTDGFRPFMCRCWQQPKRIFAGGCVETRLRSCEDASSYAPVQLCTSVKRELQEELGRLQRAANAAFLIHPQECQPPCEPQGAAAEGTAVTERRQRSKEAAERRRQCLAQCNPKTLCGYTGPYMPRLDGRCARKIAECRRNCSGGSGRPPARPPFRT